MLRWSVCVALTRREQIRTSVHTCSIEGTSEQEGLLLDAELRGRHDLPYNELRCSCSKFSEKPIQDNQVVAIGVNLDILSDLSEGREEVTMT